MSWNQFSESKLLSLEKKILSVLKSKYCSQFVSIKADNNSEEKINTISLNTESTKTPLVLLHGFAAGIGFWIRNLDTLSKDRPVYAMDLLGFGRSSRPEFSSNPLEAEKQLVNSIEAWRKQMNLDKFVLLGHSMGGYLATLYSISYPERVKHLILADPWGFADKSQMPLKDIPFRFKVIVAVITPLLVFNPLAPVRALGPFGPWLIQKLRGDIISKFDDVFDDNTIIPNYIYHCNAQNPTGETAFHNMFEGIGWAKNPMIHRVPNLKREIPITYIYGDDTWMHVLGPEIQKMRPDSYVDVQVVRDSGHHLYADQAPEFNQIVLRACEKSDEGEDILPVVAAKKGSHNLHKSEELDDLDIQYQGDSVRTVL